jgi:hypothetical protein
MLVGDDSARVMPVLAGIGKSAQAPKDPLFHYEVIVVGVLATVPKLQFQRACEA